MTWPTVAIRDVARIVGGATPKTGVADYWNGAINWATPKDLSNLNGKFIGNTPRKITDAGLRGCAAEVLPPNSVLFSSRAPIGHVAINTSPMATNQGFKSFIPGARLDADFLFWWLDAHREQLQALGTGATFKEVSKATVERIEIPLPPLEEQKRIAAILDQADALRRLRRRALNRLNTLGQAIFHEMFEYDGNDEEQKVLLSEVADIASDITKGRKMGAQGTRLVPYMAVSNVQDQHLKLDVIKEIEATEDEISRYRLRRGDLLMTEGGDPDKLGRGTLWNDELPEVIHQNHIFRVRVISDRLRPVYLQWAASSPAAKRYFLRSAKQTTGIASINKSQLGNLPLELPPIEKQINFEERLEELARSASVMSGVAKDANTLFAALQHRAFRGEL